MHQPVFLPMVQHDLRVLERLAVDEVSLITWIQECASNSSGYRDTSDVSSWARAGAFRPGVSCGIRGGLLCLLNSLKGCCNGEQCFAGPV